MILRFHDIIPPNIKKKYHPLYICMKNKFNSFNYSSRYESLNQCHFFFFLKNMSNILISRFEKRKKNTKIRMINK